VDRSRSSGPGPHAATALAAAGPVVLLALLDIRPEARLWGWSRFVVGTAPLRGVPGLRFAKLLGSGAGGSFGLTPSASIQGLFCVFDDDDAADAFAGARGALQAWRERARECFTVRLRAFSSRGTWSGTPLAIAAATPAAGPVAALTRASIRPSRMAAFWRMQPAAERSLHGAPGCRLAVGLGEAPLLRQATFSVWDSVDAMDAYARHGAHQSAIRASAAGAFFSESMFVRFVPYDARGRWQGRALA
jgi:spheroidene monooxygenase